MHYSWYWSVHTNFPHYFSTGALLLNLSALISSEWPLMIARDHPQFTKLYAYRASILPPSTLSVACSWLSSTSGEPRGTHVLDTWHYLIPSHLLPPSPDAWRLSIEINNWSPSCRARYIAIPHPLSQLFVACRMEIAVVQMKISRMETQRLRYTIVELGGFCSDSNDDI